VNANSSRNLQGERKFLKKFVVSTPKTLNEIQLLMSFNHPHIIKPELAFVEDEEVYLQFPFFEQTLKDWIKNKSIAEKRIMFFKILQTLSHIHSKFVMHRDIKFDNILVKNDEPVIIDFGIGKRDVMLQTGTIKVGTSYFMAPETKIGKNTFASDIWSVGVMMYDAFYDLEEQFGRNVIDSIHYPKILGDDEGTIVNSLKRILQLDPSTRPTASELLLDPFFLSDERKRMTNDKMVLEKDDKMKLFCDTLPKISGGSISICVPRTNVVEKLLDTVSKMNDQDLVKQLNVQFDNETGVGQGLTRELFTLFFDQIFKKNAIWKQFDESILVIPSDQDMEMDNRIWDVIGKMMLLVLLHRIPVPCQFASIVYRFLIGDEADLTLLYKEVMELEPQLARTTIQLKPTDDLSYYGDFNKDGKEVTSHNLIDFKKYRFESILIPNEICLARLKEMRKGFQTIELKELKKKLTSFELRDVLCGVPMMDPNELWSQIDASRLDKTTQDFLKQVVMEMTSDQLRQLLYWVTCLSAVPISGLQKKIQLVPSHQGFNAHTCFFQLEVYTLHHRYEDFKKTFISSLEQAQAGVFVE
jgi:serine/threonine protein kinase